MDWIFDILKTAFYSSIKWHLYLLQSCVEYCANDVKATYEVFSKVWSEFQEHAPHPVTFAGMLEMGTSYLPIDDSWERYIKDSNETYEDLENEMKNTLMKLAEDSCRLVHKKR